MNAKNASERLGRAVRSVIERLEDRRLLAADPLAYQNVVQSLPYALDFTQQVNGVFDKSGQSVGFTRVQANRLGNQYQPNLLNLNTSSGELDVTTTGTSSAGSNFGTDNTQVNALETQFDGTTSGFTITTRLKGPLGFMNAAYDGGGVYFGPDQDNYVKFIAEYDAVQGQVLQFADEQSATIHTVNVYTNIGSFANISTLDLRLTGDAGSGRITASYSVNGGTFVSLSQAVQLTGSEQSGFFNSASRAGILASNKNDLPGITVPFMHFEIDPGSKVAAHPTIISASPANGTTDISLDTSITADLNLPNAGLDPATLNSNTVQLYRSSDHALVPAVVNTSGGGDSIVLQPTSNLAPNTSYTFSVTSGVQDTTGASIVPYQLSFMTGATTSQANPLIQFQQVGLASATGAPFTDVQIGPDHKLYASSEDGLIYRYAINPDGTLGAPQIITSFQQYEGGKRLITGFAFDPHATASNPIIWVSNSYYAFQNTPDWTGKITVMSGPDLQTVQDAIINLPRSIQDHGTEAPIFGPDGALYVAQGSDTAMGAPDSTWGMRPEHLLSAAILRIDPAKLNLPQGPVDVLTPDGGGTYNPFAPGAPLTIYASGVRNAFALVWTSDGTLYAANNGSSAGGNTPAFPNNVNGNRLDTNQPYNGSAVPGLTNVPQSEIDELYKIQQGGYYGHPNPYRGEYVLDAGNTGNNAPDSIPQYPAGTQPDPNYRGIAYNFGLHRSPDGIIQYQDKTFGGLLQGALLVTEYSAGSDIVALTRDGAGNVVGTQRGIPGFSHLNNPLGLIEDQSNGNVYVAELGGQKLVLLRPIPPHATASVSKSLMAFNAVNNSGPSPAQTLTITNTGDVALSINGIAIVSDPSVTSSDAHDFTIENSPSLPASIAPGQSLSFQVRFSSPASGLHSALLRIQSNDAANPLTVVALRGLGTTGTGGANEPSLAAILREYEIPSIVGDGFNDANAYASTFYPNPPDASSQEISMQRMVKAGDGPVTISLLASFANTVQPVARFGTYIPGDATDMSELFSINQSDSQTVNPVAQGATSFDPGSSAFGLYTLFPNVAGVQHIAYSEDALNTWDANVPRKIRFFPLENADGSVVPNAYVFAAEDNNKFFPPNIQPYDSNDVVGIIRNVKPAAVGSPVLGLENLDGAPSSTRMVFNRIQNPNSTSTVNPPSFRDAVHDTATLRIHNTGTQPLVISGLTLSDSTNWQIVNPPAPGTTVAANGGTLDITIKFIATTDPSHTDNQTNDTQTVNGLPVAAAGGVWNGTLTISSNDPLNPTRTVQLAGYWQYMSENENEPGLQTIVNRLYGYGTNISNTFQPNYPNNGATKVYYGEEVASGLWQVADPTQQVSVRQLAAFHNQWSTWQGQVIEPATTLYWYPQGGGWQKLFQDQPGESQSLFPTVNGSTTTPAAASFSPSGTFGWNIDGEDSQDQLNTTDINTYGRSGHAVRFWPARDGAGNLIPNTWLMVNDYQNSEFENADFQDNVYLVTNMQPAGLPLAPQDVQATGGAGGISLQWQAVNDSTLAGYNIYRGTSATGQFTKINASPIGSTSYIDTFAPPGVTTYYRITAVSSKGESIGQSASAMAVPAAPTNVTANATASGQVQLSWTAAPGGVAYHIERQAAGENGFVEVGTSSGTSFTDTGLSGGVTYVYQLRVENGSGFSPYSQVAMATTPVGGTPAAPSGLIATASSSGQINLVWTNNANNQTGFSIERSLDGLNFTQIATVGPTTTNYSDAGLAPSTSYTYRIRATNASGNSPYTALAVAKTAGPSATAPAAPSNLVATGISPTQINLTWTDNAGGNAGFVIVRATGGGGFVQVATVAAGLTSWSDTGLTPNTRYTYDVQAVNSGGQSAYSNTASAATLPGDVGSGHGDPFDVAIGKGGAKSLRFTDADGTVTTITFTGPGSAIAHFGGTGFAQGAGKGVFIVAGTAALSGITATGTTAATSLNFVSRGGNGTIDLGGLTTDGSFGSINAKTASLTGDLTSAGLIRQLALAAAQGGTISASAINNASFSGVFADAVKVNSLGSIRSGSIAGGAWNVAGNANSILTGSATGWSATFGGTLISLNVTHDASMNLTAGAIRNIKVGGALTQSTINSAGNIVNITAGSMEGAGIYAGVSPASTSLTIPAAGNLGSASIGSVTLRNTRSAATFANSVIAAGSIGHLSLGGIQTANNGTPFGTEAHKIGSLIGIVGGKRLSLRNLTSSSDVATSLAKEGINPGDMLIKLV